MQNSQLPSKFPIPFASGAGVGFTRQIPQASQQGIAAGAASLTDGFPPACFQPVGAGGTPPFGQDFNGLLNQETAWSQWQQAGGMVQFDQTFANAIGGYPKWAFIASKVTAALYWINTVENNTTDPEGAAPSGWVAFGFVTAPQTYFVNASTGSDSNNGLTSGTAFATLQKAANTVSKFNLNGFSVTINVADGTYAPIGLPPVNGSGTISFVGNTGTPSNCVISSSLGTCISAVGAGSGYSFNGFKVQCSAPNLSTGDGGFGINAQSNTNINIQNFVFGTCQGGHINASSGASVILSGALTISGGLTANAAAVGAHIAAANGASVVSLGAFGAPSLFPSLTISAAVSLPFFVFALANGSTSVLYSSITGATNVTGQKFVASLNGVINTNGAGTSYYPGTVAGGTTTGGQYA